MAPNSTTSRKTPAGAPRAAKADEKIPLESLFDDLQDENESEMQDESKKKLPTVKNPGNWNSEHTNPVSGTKLKELSLSSNSINKVPSNLSKAFSHGKPMADKPELLKCTHCKRTVSKHSMPKHIEGCLSKKQEKQRKKKEAKDARDAAARRERAGDSDEEEDDDAKKTASKTGGLAASKKRKAIDEGEEAGGPTKKKKKKDDAKAKAPRPKAPIDVEKQCGVPLDNGGMCARSLTCKSHSMGAKRAVAGRSAPYDKLLMEYQRKNQAKLQKAAFDANAPNPDDESLPSGPVDSEEEKDAVMASIARSWGGRPIYQPMRVPLRRKYEYNRMKGMMASAFGNRGAGPGLNLSAGSGAGFFGPAPVVPTDAESILNAKRQSVAANARGMMAPSRKPSVASAGA